MYRPAYSGAYSRRRFSNYSATEKETVGTETTGFTLAVACNDPSMGRVNVKQLTDVSPLSSQSAAQDGPASRGVYAAGHKFRAEALPATDCRFVKWETNIDGVGNTATNPLEFKLTKNTTLVAHFEKVGSPTPSTRTANVTWDGKMGRVNGNSLVLDDTARTGSGVVTASQGSSVTLTASPLAGYRFVKWRGAPVDGKTSSTITFQMNSNYNIKAEFAAEDPGNGGGGGGSVIGGGGGGGSPTDTPSPTVTTVSKKETGVKAFVKKWWWAILIVAYVVYKEMKGGSK